MNKFGKMRVIAAFTLALTMLASVAAPSFASAEGESVIKSFEPRAVEIDGENEALSGWQYYFYNASLNWYYQSNELFVRATKNGRTGNAMEIERKKATDELWVSSYSFAVKPDTEYNISSFVKTTDSSCKLVWCVKELDENGNDVTDSATNGSTQYIDRYSFGGKYDNWTETSFTRKTEATTKKMILRIRAEGTGIIDLDDITVRPNTISYRMMSIGNDGSTEKPATYNAVTADNLSEESSDGDGKSLWLKDHDVFMPSFGMLPHETNYRLSFKYKRVTSNSDDRLSIYLDNMNSAMERKWSADGVSGGSTAEWTSYSYDFNAKSTQTDITFMRITSYGSYLIDELEINTLNENVLNGSFEKNYGNITVDNATITANNIVSDDYGKALKLEAGKSYRINYSMILPKNAKYRLSFKYKKLNTSETAGKHNESTFTGNGLLIFTDGYNTNATDSRFYDMGYNNLEELNQWQEFSKDFYSLTGADSQYAAFVPCYGDYLIDDLSVKCVDDTFADVQYVINGNFGGAYLDGYKFDGTSNFGFAKQSDGNFAFGSMHYTWNVGTGNRGYFRIKTDMLEKSKEYVLSFDYYATGKNAEVLGVYNGNASGVEKRFVSINSPVTKWTHHEAKFTAGQFEQDFLEVYGTAYGQNSTFIRNIQITDKETGATYITNQTLVAPDKQSSTIYTANFGAGSADYTWKDWNIVNGGIYGFKYEDGNDEYKVCLNGSAGNPATAVTKDIDVAGARLISVDKKIYFTEDSAFGSNLTVTVLAGENEIKADKNGYFSLPEGTTTIKVKFSTEEYVTFKKVFVKFTGIGTAAGASIRANTPYGIRWTVRVKTAEWNKLVEAYGEANVKAGVIVAPLEYLGSGETAVPFTIDAFKAANLKYVDIVTDTFNAKLENKVEGYSGFYASLVNIKAGNLNRKFIARSYVAVTKDGVTAYYYGEYSAEDNARTIYEVGKGAIASDAESENVKTFVKNEVLDKIADVTVKDGVAAMTAINGYTSPYSVSINGKVLTITVMGGADVNLSEVLKIVCVNGKNYKPAVSGNLATVTIN